MSQRSKQSNQLLNVLLCLVFGPFIFSFVGCVTGCVVGYQAGFSGMDGGSETVYVTGGGTGDAVPLWFVAYDEDDEPVFFSTSSEESNVPDGLVAMPEYYSTAATGPWNESSFAEGQEFTGGGFSFRIIGEEIYASMILYPTRRDDNWVRYYYEYKIQDDRVKHLKVWRERGFNEWGGEVVFWSTLLGIAGGAVLGLIIGAVTGAVLSTRAARKG